LYAKVDLVVITRSAKVHSFSHYQQMRFEKRTLNPTYFCFGSKTCR